MTAIHDSFSEIIYCMSRQKASSHIASVFDIWKIILGSNAVHSRYVEKYEYKMILTVRQKSAFAGKTNNPELSLLGKDFKAG